MDGTEKQKTSKEQENKEKDIWSEVVEILGVIEDIKPVEEDKEQEEGQTIGMELLTVDEDYYVEIFQAARAAQRQIMISVK